MESNPKVTAIYRIAEKRNKNTKVKPDYVNNIACLDNFIATRSFADIVILGDNLDSSTEEYIQDLPDFVTYKRTKAHGNSETFLEAFELALTYPGVIYFVEDDYLHLPNWDKSILEGLQKTDYVSLYDHPDKYDGRITKLILGSTSHWQYTLSTTMTFAAKSQTLAQDQALFKRYITTGNPPDHYIFSHLNQNGRKLSTPIPARATHGETRWLSPYISWSQI